MAEAGAGAGAGAGTGAGAGAVAPWYQGVAGVDDAMIGHLQNRGWDKKTAAEAAVEATKAWKEAEKHIGAPADQLLRMPKDAADEAGWNQVHTKLGRPADAKGYDLTTIKRADGAALDEATDTMLRDQAFRLNLSKDKATEFASDYVKREDGSRTSAKADTDAKLIVEKQELARSWGANFEANKFVATRAAAALGVDPATVASLEGVIGYAKVMEMFRSIGSKIGEDKFVNSLTPGGNGVMTREQAVARINELKADTVWSKAYLAGDSAKAREMQALHVVAQG